MTGHHLSAIPLQTKRLRLRPLALSDAEAMHEIYADPETLCYWSCKPARTMDDTRGLVQKDLDAAARGQGLFWAVSRARRPECIGKCVLFQIDETNQRAEVGFLLNRRYWRSGLMREAMSAVIDHAFGELGLHRLEADTDPQNAASLGLLERLGFKQEGLFRERWLVNGKRADSVMLGLLRPDWEGLDQP